MSQWFLSYRVLLFLFHFCVFLLQLSELVWKLAEGISLQSASKRLPSFGPSSNGNKSNAINTRICPNWNLTGTIYHWSVILRSFSVVSNSAKRDANGFFKLLLLSSHLLISGHPVRKSKFGACAVTGYCSFNQHKNPAMRSHVGLQAPLGWKVSHVISRGYEKAQCACVSFYFCFPISDWKPINCTSFCPVFLRTSGLDSEVRSSELLS